MDLNDYWQENKRFLTIVAGGLLVFLIGEMVIPAVSLSRLFTLTSAGLIPL